MVNETNHQPQHLLAAPVDPYDDFYHMANTFFLADTLGEFDAASASGKIKWTRNHMYPRVAFNRFCGNLRPFEGLTFPDIEYAKNPVLPFSIEFVSSRTLRLRVRTSETYRTDEDSVMLANNPVPVGEAWKQEKFEGGYRYASEHGSVSILENPWRIQLHDAKGKLLTETFHQSDNRFSQMPILPFSFVRRTSDMQRGIAANFTLKPGEKLFGCGESFTRLDKRGQKIRLCVNDPQCVLNQGQYKPVPFFMSNEGYGMFIHSSAPITCDFGNTCEAINSLLLAEDQLDLFIFLGEPKEILDQYTNLTGKSPMPPLWSFGHWMSRITYFSEEEGRDIAGKLKEHRIPTDVIHFDTGWFETDWRCDYEFAPSRFDDAGKMIQDLLDDGYHISLWQLPYFVPANRFFKELVEKGLVVKDANGNLPYEDAVLDFSNPETVSWYQEKIAKLLELGVGAIKVDFGEAAPYNGLYASGKTGMYEHNLYPLRYNKAVADITREVKGENVIWARSAWAGSQRYPLHWGGDAPNTDMGMQASMRGGLSIGLSGFSFWSHDIGGFTSQTPEELYRRWLPFGMLTSHSRSHGAPPKEPWLFNESFCDAFREAAELKYKLMPYVYAQAKDSSNRGLPMLRALFVEFPEDAGAWTVEDQYLFGSDILVAPLMHAGETARDVYLPGGDWVDYQSGESYSKGWHRIESGKIPAIILVRSGAVIPHIAPALSTKHMDWSKIELRSYGAAESFQGLVFLPGSDELATLEVKDGKLLEDPCGAQVEFTL